MLISHLEILKVAVDAQKMAYSLSMNAFFVKIQPAAFYRNLKRTHRANVCLHLQLDAGASSLGAPRCT